MGGNLIFTGTAWNNTNNTADRTLTFSGNGNTVIEGNIVTSGASFVKDITKQGTGILTLNGTGNVYNGTTLVQSNGALRVRDFRALTNNSANIQLGAGTNQGGSLIIGSAATVGGAADLISAKTIVLGATSTGFNVWSLREPDRNESDDSNFESCSHRDVVRQLHQDADSWWDEHSR